MRVLLIEPPFHRFMGFYRHYFPLGLAYIASALSMNGHLVKIYDAEHDPQAVSTTYLEATQNYAKYLEAIESNEHPVWLEIEREVSRFQPDLVGISVLTVKVPSASRIAEICHAKCGNIPIVVGGEHPTARPLDLLTDKNVTFAVRGEGEQTMCELVRALENGGLLEGIDGLSFKQNGKVTQNRDRRLIEDLDSVPIPARELLVNRETYRPIDFGLIMGSRGCPYACTFCPNRNIWRGPVRFRSPRAVVDEIKRVREVYSTGYFSFRDYSFSIKPRWVEEFCSLLAQQGLDIQWECTTRADLLSRKTVSMMKDAGCATIRVGIESGSERILREIRKDVSLDEVRAAAKVLKDCNMYWAGYFMFGLPSETEEDIHKTLAFIDEIDPPFVTMARYTPLPGTEIYDTLVREGRIVENHIDWGQWGNQWLQKSFTRAISPWKFAEIVEEVARWIHEHNSQNRLETPHPLLKLG